MLLTVGDRRQSAVETYVAEEDLGRLRGSTHLAADGESLLLGRLRQLARVLLREAGF